MADQKISLLNELVTIETGDLFAIVDITATAETKKVTIDNVQDYLEANLTLLGEVTGNPDATAIDPTAITNKTTVAGEAGDFVLVSDTSDSGNLKKVDVADLLGGGLSANTDLFLPVSDGSALQDSLLRQDASTGATDLLSDAVNILFTITGNGTDANSIKLVSEYDAVNGYGIVTFDGLTGGLFSVIDDKDNELWTASDVSGNPIGYIDADWLVEFGNPFDRPLRLVYDAISGDTDFFMNAIRYNITNLVDYADDASAGIGGLVTGDLYRTTATKAIAVKD